MRLARLGLPCIGFELIAPAKRFLARRCGMAFDRWGGRRTIGSTGRDG